MKPITERLLARYAEGHKAPIITAHSGCEGTPDNSIEHIRTAIASGAEAFEVDIHYINGELILTHDAPQGEDRIPTLADAFRLASEHPSICVNCDLKQDHIKEHVIALPKEYGMEDRILFTGYYYHEEENPMLAATTADWWINTDNNAADNAYAIYANLNNEYRVFNINYNTVYEEGFLDRVNEAGYHLSTWTVNDEQHLREMMAIPCVRNITTRIPKLALAIRKELFGE